MFASNDIESELVSVVLPTMNSERYIDMCLKSVSLQDYKNIEIILVDDAASIDKTREIAKKYTDFIYINGPERAIKRNYGVSVSNGKYLMHIDADMILSPSFISSCVSNMRQKQYLVGLYTPEVVLGKSFWGKVRRFERNFYNGTVIDSVRFIRKDAFIKSGGFDPTIIGVEDWDIDKKLLKIGKLNIAEDINLPKGVELSEIKVIEWEKNFSAFLKEHGISCNYKNKPILFHNESDFNFKKYINKKNYYMASFNAYIKKWGECDPIIIKQFGVRYRYFSVFIENDKWKKLFKHPILTLGMYFLRFSVGIVFLKNMIFKRKITK